MNQLDHQSIATARATQFAAMKSMGQNHDPRFQQLQRQRDAEVSDPKLSEKVTEEFNQEESTEYDAEKVEDYWKKQLSKENYKQEELMRLREQILSVAEHQTITGYTEVLIGEKDNPFEDEEDNQKKLKKINDQIKTIVAMNMGKLKRVIDPKSLKPDKEFDVKEYIANMEKRLCNQYFDKLSTICKEDKLRKMKESASPRQLDKGQNPDLIVSQSSFQIVTSTQHKSTLAENQINQQSFSNLFGQNNLGDSDKANSKNKKLATGTFNMQKISLNNNRHRFSTIDNQRNQSIGYNGQNYSYSNRSNNNNLSSQNHQLTSLNMRLDHKRMSEISQRNQQMLMTGKNRAASSVIDEQVAGSGTNLFEKKGNDRDFARSQLSLQNNDSNYNQNGEQSSIKLGGRSTQVGSQLTLMPQSSQNGGSHNNQTIAPVSSLSPMDQYGSANHKSSLQFIPSQQNVTELNKTQQVDQINSVNQLQHFFLEAKRQNAGSSFSLNEQLQGLQKNFVNLMFMGQYDRQVLEQQRQNESNQMKAANSNSGIGSVQTSPFDRNHQKNQSNSQDIAQFFNSSFLNPGNSSKLFVGANSNQNQSQNLGFGSDQRDKNSSQILNDLSIKNLKQDILRDLHEANTMAQAGASPNFLGGTTSQMNQINRTAAPSELSNKHLQSLDGPTRAIYNHGTFTGTFNIGATQQSAEIVGSVLEQRGPGAASKGAEEAVGQAVASKTLYDGRQRLMEDNKPAAWKIDGGSESQMMLNSSHQNGEADRKQNERKFIDLKYPDQANQQEGESNRESSLFEDTVAQHLNKQMEDARDFQVQEEEISSQYPSVFQNYPDFVADPEQTRLDENLKILEDRLQQNLSKNKNMKQIKVFSNNRNELTKNQNQLFSRILEDDPYKTEPDSSKRIRFKSSHISFVSSLISQKHLYAENLRKIDENRFGRDPRKIVQHQTMLKQAARAASEPRDFNGSNVSLGTQPNTSRLAPSVKQFSFAGKPDGNSHIESTLKDMNNENDQKLYQSQNQEIEPSLLNQPSFSSGFNEQFMSFSQPNTSRVYESGSGQQNTQTLNNSLPQISPLDLHIFQQIQQNRLQQLRFNEYRDRFRKLARGGGQRKAAVSSLDVISERIVQNGHQSINQTIDASLNPNTHHTSISPFKIDIIAPSRSKQLKDLKRKHRQEQMRQMMAEVVEDAERNLGQWNRDLVEGLGHGYVDDTQRYRKAKRKPPGQMGLRQMEGDVQITLPHLSGTVDASKLSSYLATPSALQGFSSNPIFDQKVLFGQKNQVINGQGHFDRRDAVQDEVADSNEQAQISLNQFDKQIVIGQNEIISQQVTITDTQGNNQDPSNAEVTLKKSKSVMNENVIDDNNTLRSLGAVISGAEVTNKMDSNSAKNVINFVDDKFKNEHNLPVQDKTNSDQKNINEDLDILKFQDRHVSHDFKTTDAAIKNQNAVNRKPVDLITGDLSGVNYNDQVSAPTVGDINSDSKSAQIDSEIRNATIIGGGKPRSIVPTDLSTQYLKSNFHLPEIQNVNKKINSGINMMHQNAGKQNQKRQTFQQTNDQIIQQLLDAVHTSTMGAKIPQNMLKLPNLIGDGSAGTISTNLNLLPDILKQYGSFGIQNPPNLYGIDQQNKFGQNFKNIHPFKQQKILMEPHSKKRVANSIKKDRKQQDILNMDLVAGTGSVSAAVPFQNESFKSRKTSDARSHTIEISAQGNYQGAPNNGIFQTISQAPQNQIQASSQNATSSNQPSASPSQFLKKVAQPKLKEIHNISGRQTQLTIIHSIDSSQQVIHPKQSTVAAKPSARSQSHLLVLHPSKVEPQMESQQKKLSPRQVVEEQKRLEQEQRVLIARRAIEEKRRRNKEVREVKGGAGQGKRVQIRSVSVVEGQAQGEEGGFKQNLRIEMNDLGIRDLATERSPQQNLHTKTDRFSNSHARSNDFIKIAEGPNESNQSQQQLMKMSYNTQLLHSGSQQHYESNINDNLSPLNQQLDPKTNQSNGQRGSSTHNKSNDIRKQKENQLKQTYFNTIQAVELQGSGGLERKQNQFRARPVAPSTLQNFKKHNKRASIRHEKEKVSGEMFIDGAGDAIGLNNTINTQSIPLNVIKETQKKVHQTNKKNVVIGDMALITQDNLFFNSSQQLDKKKLTVLKSSKNSIQRGKVLKIDDSAGLLNTKLKIEGDSVTHIPSLAQLDDNQKKSSTKSIE